MAAQTPVASKAPGFDVDLAKQPEAYPVILMAGTRGTVIPDPAGGFRMVHGGPVDGDPEAAPAPAEAKTERTTIVHNASFATPDGTLTFTLWSDSRTGTRLKVENGLDRRVAYELRLVFPGRDPLGGVPTTICSIEPHGVAYEGWVQPVDAVRIIRIVESPSDKRFCYDPSNKAQPFYDPPAN